MPLAFFVGACFQAGLFPFEDGFNRQGLEQLTFVGVIRIVGDSTLAVRTVRGPGSFEAEIEFAFADAEVVKGSGLPPGAQIRAGQFALGPGKVRAGRLVRDAHYLVVASKSASGPVLVPDPSFGIGGPHHAPPADPGHRYVEVRSALESILLVAFPCGESAYPDSGDAWSRILRASAECFTVATPDTAAALLRFLDDMRPTELTSDDPGKTFEDIGLTSRLREIAQRVPPIVRLRIFQLLAAWRVRKCERSLWESMAECSLVPLLGTGAYGELGRYGPMYTVGYLDRIDMRGYDYYRPSGNWMVETIELAQNKPIRNYFLKYLYPPTQTHLRRLAALLNRPESDLQWNVVEALQGQFDEVPVRLAFAIVNGVRQPTNLSACVQYWKSRFGV